MDNIRVKTKPRAHRQDNQQNPVETKHHAIQSIILSSECFQDESLSVCQRILSDTAWNFILFRLFCFLSFKLSLTFGDMLQGYLPYLCKPPLQTFYLSLSAMVLFIQMPNSSFPSGTKTPREMFRVKEQLLMDVLILIDYHLILWSESINNLGCQSLYTLCLQISIITAQQFWCGRHSVKDFISGCLCIQKNVLVWFQFVRCGVPYQKQQQQNNNHTV